MTARQFMKLPSDPALWGMRQEVVANLALLDEFEEPVWHSDGATWPRPMMEEQTKRGWPAVEHCHAERLYVDAVVF